jgi:hypothetical protein
MKRDLPKYLIAAVLAVIIGTAINSIRPDYSRMCYSRSDILCQVRRIMYEIRDGLGG